VSEQITIEIAPSQTRIEWGVRQSSGHVRWSATEEQARALQAKHSGVIVQRTVYFTPWETAPERAPA
jgi:hypothetical protein